MPETPQQLYDRVADNLRVPPVHEWDSWPFEGEMQPRRLRPPEPEPRIEGQDGVDCAACTKPDSEYAWSNDRWRLLTLGPSGLPIVVLLEPREHYAGPADLPEDLAREQGVMLGLVERAVLSVGQIGKVHIGRWGEGAEHLHWVVHRPPRRHGPAAQLDGGDLGRGPTPDAEGDLRGQPGAGRPVPRGARLGPWGRHGCSAPALAVALQVVGRRGKVWTGERWRAPLV